jgi:hypothetical protein
MSKFGRQFGWDLPPGVSTSDLPGNSPEEQRQEAFLDAFYDQMTKLRLPLIKEEKLEDLSGWIWKQILEAYSEGYVQARDDQRMAEEQAHLDAMIDHAHKDGTMP